MSYSCRRSHILGSKTVSEGLLINRSRCGRTYWADSAILRILVVKCCGAQTRHRVCVTLLGHAAISNKNAKCKHFEHHGPVGQEIHVRTKISTFYAGFAPRTLTRCRCTCIRSHVLGLHCLFRSAVAESHVFTGAGLFAPCSQGGWGGRGGQKITPTPCKSHVRLS